MTGIQRIKTAALALAMLLVMGLSFALTAEAVSAGSFTDVPRTAWYYDAVDHVASKGLFNGTTTTTFSPQGTMTRGMFITVLGRYAGVDPEAWCAAAVTGEGVRMRSGPGTSYSVLEILSKNTTVTLTGKSGSWYKIRYGSRTGYMQDSYISPKYHSFSDVDYGSYYAGYTIWGYEKGIVKGESSSIFAPGRNVTREQICQFLNSYAGYAGISLTGSASVTFTDAGSISSWAKTAVTAMHRAGIVTGEQSGSGYIFRPRSSATRAEAAAIFQRFSKLGGSGTAPGPTGGGTTTTPPPAPTGGGTSSDTPATLLSDKIAVRSETVRVGILADSQNYKNAVSAVTLQLTNGSGFEYGTFSTDRSFRAAGTVSSASITVTTSGGALTVKNASGSVVHTTSGNLALRPIASGKALTRVNGQNRYYGGFELRRSSQRTGYISVINYVNIEDYVKGVIPYEFGAGWPTETLKAAAVATRNYVMSLSWSTYSPYGFDVLPNTSAQVYKGRGASYGESYFSATDGAVSATTGLYLTYKSGGANRLCETYYFSSDGGATEDSAHIWGGSYSYLVGKKDPYEAAAANMISSYTQSKTCSRTGTAMTELAKNAGLGNTTIAKNGIKIDAYPATGNVRSITLTGINGRTVTISQKTSFDRWDFLSAFGISYKSYNYSVTYDPASDSFTCTRRGWGHNVGLSQWGAYAMAKYYNKSYQDILGFYYTGTHLQYGVY